MAYSSYSTPSNGITFDTIVTPINNGVMAQEANLRSVVASIGQNPSTLDMLNMQQAMTKWSMMIQLQSTLIKELGDTMKSVIQKAG